MSDRYAKKVLEFGHLGKYLSNTHACCCESITTIASEWNVMGGLLLNKGALEALAHSLLCCEYPLQVPLTASEVSRLAEKALPPLSDYSPLLSKNNELISSILQPKAEPLSGLYDSPIDKEEKNKKIIEKNKKIIPQEKKQK
jgi:hypothetical protein